MKIILAIDPAQPIEAYRDALLSSGALPGEVEIVQPGDALPPEFDGLLLSGGADVDPARYGEAPVNGSVRTNEERDRLDFDLLERADRIGAAVFGICRGLQVVNVALGGTLWQDLPAQRERGVPHSFPRSENDPGHPAHVVRAAPAASRLPLAAAVAAVDGAFVNSRHHQAVKDLAAGLVPLAASPDGHNINRECGSQHPEALSRRVVDTGADIGLAFDGNWEAMSGDVAYEPELQRTIAVDIRYVLWVIDIYSGAGHLVDEMTLVR